MKAIDIITGIDLGKNVCVRVKRGRVMPIRDKRGKIACATTHRACNHYLAGYARFYRVPAWLELRNGQPTVTFIHGITKYTSI